MASRLSALILAAGKGVRMKSDLPKVLHPLLGQPMVRYVIDAARGVGSDPVHVVVGFGRDRMRETLAPLQVGFVEQTEQLGTGHAVQCFARVCPTPPGQLLIVCGDTPLLARESLQQLVDEHFRTRPALTMLTLEMQNPGTYGRILRDAQGNVLAIREAKDCTPEQRAVREVNLAVYLFDGNALYDRIFHLENRNAQKEFYLTDLVEMLARDGLPVRVVKERDEASTLGINSRSDLAKVAGILKGKILDRLMADGVTIMDPLQTWVEPDVEIGPETTIWPGTTITRGSRIGARCQIGPGAFIDRSLLGDGVTARFAVVREARIADQTELPAFSTTHGDRTGSPRSASEA